MTKPAAQTIIHPSLAWVVFSGHTDYAWLKILKPGFRHCYVVLKDNRQWMTIDPLFPYTEVVNHEIPLSFDLPQWLRGRGYTVVPARLNRDSVKPAPLMLFTCVEAVKRILGIHARHVLTPWQLYKYLHHTPLARTIQSPTTLSLTPDKGETLWEV